VTIETLCLEHSSIKAFKKLYTFGSRRETSTLLSGCSINISYKYISTPSKNLQSGIKGLSHNRNILGLPFDLRHQYNLSSLFFIRLAFQTAPNGSSFFWHHISKSLRQKKVRVLMLKHLKQGRLLLEVSFKGLYDLATSLILIPVKVGYIKECFLLQRRKIHLLYYFKLRYIVIKHQFNLSNSLCLILQD